MLRPCSLAALLLLTAPAAADDGGEPPLVGRPAEPPFSGAVGPGRFTVSVEARPTELRVGDAIALTARVTTTAPWQRAPERPNLRRNPAFNKQFQVEDLPRLDRYQADGRTWEFHYR